MSRVSRPEETRNTPARTRELKNNATNVLRFVTLEKLDKLETPVELEHLVGETIDGKEQAIRCRTQAELDRLRELLGMFCPDAGYSTTSIGGCNFQTVTTPVGIIRYVCV